MSAARSVPVIQYRDENWTIVTAPFHLTLNGEYKRLGMIWSPDNKQWRRYNTDPVDVKSLRAELQRLLLERFPVVHIADDRGIVYTTITPPTPASPHGQVAASKTVQEMLGNAVAANTDARVAATAAVPQTYVEAFQMMRHMLGAMDEQTRAITLNQLARDCIGVERLSQLGFTLVNAAAGLRKAQDEGAVRPRGAAPVIPSNALYGSKAGAQAADPQPPCSAPSCAICRPKP